jgi:antitoxin MazE
MAIKTHLIRIGNSRGIRIPKAMLEESRLSEQIEIRAERGRLIVKSAHSPRKGWAEAARRMRENDQARLLDSPTSTRFDKEEWEW